MPQQPFGDIYSAALPETQQASNQLFQQQYQRQLMMRKEGDMLDATMNRELPKLRGADVPEFTNSYQQYKNYKQQLYFNKDIQRDPVKYNQIQAKANEALSNAYKLADDSTAENQRQRQIAQGRKTKPDLYEDTTGDMLNKASGMTTKELRDHPLGNTDSYMYHGSNTDWGKMDNQAAGQPKEVPYTKNENVDAKGVQSNVTHYTFGNTPAQHYSYLIGEMKHGAARDARNAYAQIDPADMEAVHQRYLAIPDEQWQQMGTTRQDLPEGNTPEEKFARYKTELYTLNNQPKGKTQLVTNKVADYDMKSAEREKLQKNSQKQQILMASIKNNQAIGRINLHRLYSQQDAAGQDALVDAHFDTEFQDASKQQPISIPTESGKPLVGFQVNPIGVVAKEFAGKDEKGIHAAMPDRFILSPDGKTMTGVFVKMGPDGKTGIVDNSRTISKDVNNDLKPVFKNFAVPKSKVPDQNKVVPPKPKIPVTVHKGMFD